MPTVTIVDSDTFTITPAPSPESYSVANIQGQIQTVQEQIAQTILNAGNQAQSDLAPLMAKIAALQALLTQAEVAGMTIPAGSTLDTSGLQSDLAALIAKATTEAGGVQA